MFLGTRENVGKTDAEGIEGGGDLALEIERADFIEKAGEFGVGEVRVESVASGDGEAAALLVGDDEELPSTGAGIFTGVERGGVEEPEADEAWVLLRGKLECAKGGAYLGEFFGELF